MGFCPFSRCLLGRTEMIAYGGTVGSPLYARGAAWPPRCCGGVAVDSKPFPGSRDLPKTEGRQHYICGKRPSGFGIAESDS
jgi:hypothetical protein